HHHASRRNGSHTNRCRGRYAPGVAAPAHYDSHRRGRGQAVGDMVMTKVRTALLTAFIVCGFGVVVSPQVQLDVCGCKNNPATLGNLDSTVPARYPPGTTRRSYNTMEIPLPDDGVMVFNSINLAERPPYVGGYGLTVRFI